MALLSFPNMGFSASLMLLAGLALVGYGASIAFYRMFLHPLAKFPGPKIAGLTRWYECYQEIALRGHFLYDIEKMHEKYGR